MNLPLEANVKCLKNKLQHSSLSSMEKHMGVASRPQGINLELEVKNASCELLSGI